MLLNYVFVKKTKTPTKMKNFDKKISPRFLECAKRHVFRLSKKTVLRVLLFFLTRECPILTALKQMILDEIRQSNGIKSQKINFFMIFCKFLPHKDNFCWKVPSKVVYTFYMKHQKYPFWAPISHPLSETESYANG